MFDSEKHLAELMGLGGWGNVKTWNKMFKKRKSCFNNIWEKEDKNAYCEFYYYKIFKMKDDLFIFYSVPQ